MGSSVKTDSRPLGDKRRAVENNVVVVANGFLVMPPYRKGEELNSSAQRRVKCIHNQALRHIWRYLINERREEIHVSIGKLKRFGLRRKTMSSFPYRLNGPR